MQETDASNLMLWDGQTRVHTKLDNVSFKPSPAEIWEILLTAAWEK